MNEAKLHEFMGKVVTDMGGAWMMAMVLIGDELGLYKAMADGKPTTAEALADALRLPSASGARVARRQRRLGLPRGRRRRLPTAAGASDGPRERRLSGVRGARAERRRFVLHRSRQGARRHSEAAARFPGAHIITGCSTASRSSSAQATRRTSRRLGCQPSTEWSTSSRRGAKVADVGCGHGASSIVMAKAYPNSRFVGIDFHAPSVETARPARRRRRARRSRQLHHGDARRRTLSGTLI